MDTRVCCGFTHPYFSDCNRDIPELSEELLFYEARELYGMLVACGTLWLMFGTLRFLETNSREEIDN